MQDTGAQAPVTPDEDDARLESLGYRPQLNRVLGLFANFSVAFTYLSPMVGIFSLFVLGLGSGGPAYIWLTWVPVAGMLLVALIFGELASHYPVAGALYQYSKYTVGRTFGGSWLGAALVAVLAPVYIFYGFESAGDISEETRNAGRQVPRAMRFSLLGGGIASFVLTAALLLAMPAGAGTVTDTVNRGGIPHIISGLPSWLQEVMLALIVVAFFSCGSAVQGAGSRLAFSYARDGALPGSKWISDVSQRFKTPANALFGGALVTVLFIGLAFASPTHDVKI